MLVILDCGTTNTKSYLVERDGTLLLEEYSGFGVKENALKEDRYEYEKALQTMVEFTVKKAGKDIKSLEAVIGFGMITSDLGLMELPHIEAPAGLKELQQGVCEVTDRQIFGTNTRFYLIRGIRNRMDPGRTPESVLSCDFMRGEEVQVMGIADLYHPREAVNVIIFSSHFKIIHLSADGRIGQSMTTMSGQIYDCLLNHTVVGKSIKPAPDDIMRMSQEQILELARDTVSAYGLTRAFLYPRFMEIFTDMTAKERSTYLDTVIGLEDLKAMKDYLQTGPLGTKKYYFVGQQGRCEIFARILKRVYPQAEIEILHGKEKIRDISILGALKVIDVSIKEAGDEV